MEEGNMSRRSSFGYSSYGTRSYGSGGYNGKQGRSNRMKKIVIALVCLAVIGLAAGAVCAVVLSRSSVVTSDESSEEQSLQSSAEVSEAKQSSIQESTEEELSKEKDVEGYYDGNVFMYDGSGYELFYGTKSAAGNYATVVSNIKKALGKDVRVYNMVAPDHAAIGLPEKYLKEMNDEKGFIDTVYSSYSDEVIPIDVYDAEIMHRGEYTYFRSDINWTALGAYYAYQQFCAKAGLEAISLDSLSKGSITGFNGILFTATQTEENPKGNKELAEAPDTVVYYNMPCIQSCYLLENGDTEEKEVPLIATFAEGRYAYSAFVWGDNPYMRVKTDNKTGRKLCIIKDTYGSALAPFLTANYDEVFIVDPAYYSGNIIEYIQKNKYTDVLVINSAKNAGIQNRADDIMSIIR